MRRTVLVLGILVSVVALLQVHSKARRGRQALIKWSDHFAVLGTGETIYGRNGLEEGYPTPPLSALALKPLAALGPVLGSLAFGVIKIFCAWYLVFTAGILASGARDRFPPWCWLLLLLLCTRVLLSDMAHGNINLVVAATICASARAWQRGSDLTSGIWAALGTVLKVTPAILLLLFLRKRSPRALAGFAAGLGLFLWIVPASYLGWSHNLDLLSGWWHQMIAPFLKGAPLSWVQTQHINQSLLGVSARLLTDSVAVVGKSGVEQARIALLHLDPTLFRWLFRALCAALIAWVWFSVPRDREKREVPAVLAEFAMLALLALLLSERSWKQHWVLLPLPLALVLQSSCSGAHQALARASIAVSAFAYALTGSAFLGANGSDYAEAYGAFFWAGLLLLFTAGRIRSSLLSESADTSATDPAAPA